MDTIAETHRLERRMILGALRALKRGDFSIQLPEDLEGTDGQIASAFNDVVALNRSLQKEMIRVRRAVGRDGRISERAKLENTSGGWRDCIDSVNELITDTVQQTAEISRVVGAVAKGDLSQSMGLEVDGRPLKGEFLQIAKTINTMVDRLSLVTSEVTRVAREVGTEGKLGGQAKVKGVAGTWKDLTDNVNAMATNLTGQVRNIADVTTAVAGGDLSKKITVDVKGEILELKNTINTMVDQLNSFASEVTRVAREVGTEGKLGGQAKVEGVAGTWKDLTDNVNAMATNLTSQVRNIAEVTTAVARGDLSKKITVDVKGEILELKDTINTMVGQLSSFASEVTRVAREVGTEGKLGGEAKVEGVGGTWKDLTDNVNAMATNLTSQVRNIAEVTTAVARGDLSKKITVDVQGEILELKNTINTMVGQLSSFASEVTRVAREVGTEGKLGGEAKVEGVAGTWKDLTDNVNAMATNLTAQVRNIAAVTTAVARGDLSKKITVDVKGEILELKDTINTMVDQLSSFASEVTRVAREVGTEGKLGGEARVEGVGGTWKDLTDNVNMMATNLTNQVRGIANVVTAVANGDLKRKLTVDAKGEIAQLAETINGMIDTLAIFADQVTDVAREVGIEGKLGGQARVPGAAGLWRDLTDNVNQLAANLTTQVRAIAEVATAVAKGDLTPTIDVEALGEVAALKDNINQMIANLRETTQYNTEQDWLKTNLARFTRMMQGERDLVTVCNLVLSEVAPLVDAQHGVFYVVQDEIEEPYLELTASYALNERKHLTNQLKFREGLVGQCAFQKQRILLTNVPRDYVPISSGLGEATPLSIIVLPVLFEGQVRAVIELGSFNRFSTIHQSFLDQLVESIGIVLNTIKAGMQTEDLLKQSQILTKELQSQQDELKSTNDRLEQQAATLRESEEMLKTQQDELRAKNEELEEKAVLLEAEKRQVEAINQEVETARKALEEKAEQLALTSKYKSQFLANMSHELRTPLNSLLILSKLLADNAQGNLNGKQIEQAATIHAAGEDLQRLINDVLDLSKIESGTVVLDVGDLPLGYFRKQIERTFREVAEQKGLEFLVEADSGLPKAIQTDAMRLSQIVNNLLSNAFKFTEKGSVKLDISLVKEGWSPTSASLAAAKKVVAFSISDTGIGVQPEQQQVIFEAFQQADGTTSRRFGGTGLGLSISRELASLLGGEIRLQSKPGEGSTFTLYLPLEVNPRETREDQPRAITPGVAQTDNEVAEQTAQRESREGRPILLIVEDDPIFAGILLEIADEQGFDGMVVAEGRSVLKAIKRHHPEAISLDIQLPDIDGWALLDLLKRDPETRHLPVHIVSVLEDQESLRRHFGAVEYCGKPATRDRLRTVFSRLRERVERRERNVLLVSIGKMQSAVRGELDCIERVSVSKSTPQRAALQIRNKNFDLILITTKRANGVTKIIEAARTSKTNAHTPIIVELADKLDGATQETLEVEGAVVLPGGDGSALLLNEATLTLNVSLSELSEEAREKIEILHRNDALLENKLVAIVDDDIRNIFSLTSIFEQYRMRVVHAENGRDGIALLDQYPDINAMLIDIMMPELDGYDTIRKIRGCDKYKTLPLIAVTAKAMPEDREQCFEVGATDYLSKPVDTEELIAVLRNSLRA